MGTCSPFAVVPEEVGCPGVIATDKVNEILVVCRRDGSPA
jgi:hypothetical protein